MKWTTVNIISAKEYLPIDQKLLLRKCNILILYTHTLMPDVLCFLTDCLTSTHLKQVEYEYYQSPWGNSFELAALRGSVPCPKKLWHVARRNWSQIPDPVVQGSSLHQLIHMSLYEMDHIISKRKRNKNTMHWQHTVQIYSIKSSAATTLTYPIA